MCFSRPLTTSVSCLLPYIFFPTASVYAVCRDELREFFDYYKICRDEETFEKVYSLIDTDGDGEITITEMLSVLAPKDPSELGSLDLKQRAPVPVSPLKSIGVSGLQILDLIRESIFARVKPRGGGVLHTAFLYFRTDKRCIYPDDFFETLERKFNIMIDNPRTKKEVWDAFDTDGDGSIDYAEFTTQLTK